MTFYFDQPPTGVSAQQLIDAGAAEPITFHAASAYVLGGVGYGKSALVRPIVVDARGEVGIFGYVAKSAPSEGPDLAAATDPTTAPDVDRFGASDTDRDPGSAA
ncbi:hypothetical protein [Micromonospora sp.]|uniref:hypothetical protein n=1 Tax=Micromonospora sp. TaxID=1876 RepID=UPI003B3BB45F